MKTTFQTAKKYATARRFLVHCDEWDLNLSNGGRTHYDLFFGGARTQAEYLADTGKMMRSAMTISFNEHKHLIAARYRRLGLIFLEGFYLAAAYMVHQSGRSYLRYKQDVIYIKIHDINLGLVGLRVAKQRTVDHAPIAIRAYKKYGAEKYLAFARAHGLNNLVQLLEESAARPLEHKPVRRPAFRFVDVP